MSRNHNHTNTMAGGALALIAVLLAPSTGTGETQPPTEPALLSNAAGRQIRALLSEKDSRSAEQRKLSSDLLLSMRSERGRSIREAVPDMRDTLELDTMETAMVDIKAEITPALLAEIRQAGGSVVNSFSRYGSIRARVPVAQLETLAASANVRSIRSADLYQLHQTDTSEGDVTHAAATARTTFGVDGSGVTVGVISDSVEALSDLQASGDLGPVTVLAGQSGTGTSEGTAMLEIVHDLAPGATLLFATANGGQAQFAQNILDLRAQGADVLVDDVGYFAEPVFQDGIVAQAVADVVADGAHYYSSAGNSGNLNDGTSGVWEGDFAATPPPLSLVGSGDAHDFGGGTNFNRITSDSSSFFTLHWSDPQGASGNDYDLFLLSSDLTQVFDSSTNVQDGDDDPFESIDTRQFNDANNVLVIIGRAGAQARFLHLNANRGRLQQSTAGQTAGHSAVDGAFSVAAVDFAVAGGGAFVGGAANPVEQFSSDGPRRVFYRDDGTALTPGDLSSTGGVVRQKPDIAAADGVATASPGFSQFFGTSAAAPHAAAIGALALDLDPAQTPASIRAVYEATALDIEAAGIDRDSGIGIVMADAVLAAVQPDPLENLTITKAEASTATSVSYLVTIANGGSLDATDIVATETLPVGVTLVSTTGCVEADPGTLVCALGTIPAGGSAQYSVVVTPNAQSVGLLDTPVSLGVEP
jgi:uncharacterized repeat protein (TIGR01451 family)